jgi:hypothetical protein
MDSRNSAPLTAAEYLMYKAIIERLTYMDVQRDISNALRQICQPQGNFVQDAWQRAVRRMWR